jgi:amidase/aspartyl-tRNA(Asn)/glutamyl-tRNA(Gln) amidotransferase subunit A
MGKSSELAYVTAADLAGRIRRRDLSPVEVVEACIGRIEERNPSLNALVYKGYDDARRQAREAERVQMSGEPLGPLHGVPTVMKDLFDFKPGWVSTFGGVRAFREFRADFYCAWAERMEKAGAIILGKTNSPVMGFRGTCDNYLFGPTCNPFDLARNTGGSSGGSAALVADGLVPIAEGTDGGGSIRIPAAWCNLFGYKASFGRVPFINRPDAFSGTAPFIFEGTLTRTVEDAILGLNALAGYDARDPYSLDQLCDFTAVGNRSIKGMKIAFSPDWDVFPVDSRVAAVVAKAVRVFEQAGATVEQVKVGIKRSQRELSDLWCRLIMPLNIETFESFKRQGLDLLQEHREDFPPEYLYWVEQGYKLNVLDLIRDQNMRTEVYDAIQGVLAQYDLIVTPTVAALPVPNATDGNTMGPTQIGGQEVDPLIGWCLTYFTNFTGHPSASVPAGLAEGNLPVGMQIIGRRYADADVLAASAAFERLQPWQEHYEICRNRALSV